jgi:hypothetical protein
MTPCINAGQSWMQEVKDQTNGGLVHPVYHGPRSKSKEEIMDNMKYVPMLDTPVGRIPFLGFTMTDEREREIIVAQALRNMPKYGLEATADSLDEYFRRVQEAKP